MLYRPGTKKVNFKQFKLSFDLTICAIMTVQTPTTLSRAASDSKEGLGRVVYDQFILFGDSITQDDGDPNLGFSCYQALQNGEK